MSVSPVLDDLDRALLARLGSDARTPVSALATTLGVARGTVQTRITRLLDGGVIRRFTVELDPTVDEQAVRAITLVQVSGATARAVAKRQAPVAAAAAKLDFEKAARPNSRCGRSPSFR